MNRPARVAVVVGEGGHSAQCLRLVDLLGAERCRFAYLLEAEDRLTERQLRVPGPVFRVARPTRMASRRILRDGVQFARCALQAAAILRRLRPDVVVSVGPAVAVPVSLVAKLLGCPIVYIESESRTRSLSQTGRIMRHLADLYFVQWEELLARAPRRAVFAGRLL